MTGVGGLVTSFEDVTVELLEIFNDGRGHTVNEAGKQLREIRHSSCFTMAQFR